MTGEGAPGGPPDDGADPAPAGAARPSPYGPAAGPTYGPATGSAAGSTPVEAPAAADPPSAPPAAPPPAATPRRPEVDDEVGRVAVVSGAIVAGASIVPLLNWFTWIAVPVPLVIGIVGLCLRRRPRRRSAVGIGLALLATLLTAVLPPVYAGQPIGSVWFLDDGAVDGRVAEPAPAYVDEEAARELAAVTPFTLTYEVTGTAAGVQIISSDGVQLDSGVELLEDQPLPWTRDIEVRVTRDARAVPVSLLLSALVPEEGGEAACRILVGDEVIATGSASGPGEYASCETDAYALRGFVP
ncbi:hypothetical protein [Clavibacter michiganensis]|uniref:hypothetical protein n=1 Tax=Clavibacter michiganensis TaxID=28447 RepID=UPI0005B81065|nr:hypothetical protein [Clavibacter michiganensis]